jgi:RNA polymerase sigma-70 factor (ECF subfamily)
MSKQLIERAKKGDEIALNELYETNKSKVYNYLLKLTRDETLTEHMLSITFEKAFFKIDTYKDTGNKFSTWLIAIAKNSLTDYYRRKKETIIVELTEEEESIIFNFKDGSNTIEEELIQAEKSEKLRKLLNKLNEKEKEIINLRFYENKSYKEISKELNITLDLVRIRLYRTIRELRKINYLKKQL